ncbi:hypothetical protein M422DRAFT_50098 [Sphaerobolus stellatus SS14]|uniref:Uncharacterized protein n=1 Tax=Sphaerobolus stellatus (strain SS14) TaxID=990650 RepID=A0A0C9VKC6_SPHS4|nr:hypothetical protein M422DRAFT_50098 [Sphaerobolus stellatus SS14]
MSTDVSPSIRPPDLFNLQEFVVPRNTSPEECAAAELVLVEAKEHNLAELTRYQNDLKAWEESQRRKWRMEDAMKKKEEARKEVEAQNAAEEALKALKAAEEAPVKDENIVEKPATGKATNLSAVSKVPEGVTMMEKAVVEANKELKTSCAYVDIQIAGMKNSTAKALQTGPAVSHVSRSTTSRGSAIVASHAGADPGDEGSDSSFKQTENPDDSPHNGGRNWIGRLFGIALIHPCSECMAAPHLRQCLLRIRKNDVHTGRCLVCDYCKHTCSFRVTPAILPPLPPPAVLADTRNKQSAVDDKRTERRRIVKDSSQLVVQDYEKADKEAIEVMPNHVVCEDTFALELYPERPFAERPHTPDRISAPNEPNVPDKLSIPNEQSVHSRVHIAPIPQVEKPANVDAVATVLSRKRAARQDTLLERPHKMARPNDAGDFAKGPPSDPAALMDQAFRGSQSPLTRCMLP